MRVAAIDGKTGIEVIVIAPVTRDPNSDAEHRARQVEAPARAGHLTQKKRPAGAGLLALRCR